MATPKIFKLYDLARPNGLTLKGFIRGLPLDESIESKKLDINTLIEKASPEVLAQFEVAAGVQIPSQIVLPPPQQASSSLLGALGLFTKKRQESDALAPTSGQSLQNKQDDQPIPTKPKGRKSK